MSDAAAAIAAIFDLNTDLLLNCMDGVSQDLADRRLEGGGNSMAFLVAHLTDTRHFLVRLLGSETRNPLASYLENANSIEEVEMLPALPQLLEAWLNVSAELLARLAALTPSDLERRTAQSFPIPGTTVGDALAFLAQHDSYHIGQLAFLRRQFGLPAMKYTRR